ncbi:MAG: DNA-binding protein [Pseudonocardiales bacterium]|nr:DNA-binding protein [Pseudonocardiales bacterium]
MRQLRLLRPGDDGGHLIVETADGGEQFALHVDAALHDAVRSSALRSDLPSSNPSAPEPEATISPREIQIQVRSGASPQELAERTGMTLERVLRFAGPVLDERHRIADEARRAKARRSTTEGQTVIFGEAVDARFAAHGIDPSAVTWDSRRREDGQWVVNAGWLGGDSRRVAEWIFHLAARNVTPLDDTAADLLSDRPIRPVVSAVEAPPRPSLAAAPPLAPGVVAFPVMADAYVPPVVVGHVDEVFDQDAVDEDPGLLPTDELEELEAPPLPLRLAEPLETERPAPGEPAASTPTSRLPKVKNLGVAPRDDETDEERAARARIPSWDDILLGVRRKGD